MDMSGCPFINFTQYRCHHPMWHITDADGINLFAWSLCFPFRILWGIVFHWNHRLLIVWPSPIEPLDRRSWGQRRHFAAPVYSTSSFDWHWTLRLFYWNSSPEVPVRNVKSLFMFLALAQDVLRFWYRSISRTTTTGLQEAISGCCFKPWVLGLFVTQHYCGNSQLIHNSKFSTHKASALSLPVQGESGGSAACNPAFDKVRGFKS